VHGWTNGCSWLFNPEGPCNQRRLNGKKFQATNGLTASFLDIPFQPKSPEYDHSKDSGGSCYWVWRKWGRIGALRTQGPAARSKSVKDGKKMVARARQNRRSQHSQRLSEFKGFLDKPNKHDWRVWRLARDELLRHQRIMRILMWKSGDQGFDPNHTSNMTANVSSRGCFELSSFLSEMLGTDFGSDMPLRKGNGRPDPRFKFWSFAGVSQGGTKLEEFGAQSKAKGQKGKKAWKTKKVGWSWENTALWMIVDARL
jgi:hypothetical protein